MTYVITQLCLDCKYTDCATVCPTTAFHHGPNRLFINPATCIDCEACVSECPVDAIFAEADVPAQYAGDIALNATECEKYPIIAEKMKPLKGPKCVNPNAR